MLLSPWIVEIRILLKACKQRAWDSGGWERSEPLLCLHWLTLERLQPLCSCTGAVTTAVSQHVLLCIGAVTTAVCLQVPSLAPTGAVTTAFFCYRLLGSLVHLQFISNSKAQNTRTFWDTEFEKNNLYFKFQVEILYLQVSICLNLGLIFFGTCLKLKCL